MDSKQKFFDAIYDYYVEIVGDNISPELLEELCDIITEHYYEQYTRFRKQYPKSVKRYSSFQLKDLNHPEVFEIIINFFKNKMGRKYPEYATMLLNKTLEELKEFEKNREYYHKM